MHLKSKLCLYLLAPAILLSGIAVITYRLVDKPVASTKPITGVVAAAPCVMTEAERQFLAVYKPAVTEEADTVDATDDALYRLSEQYGVTLDQSLSRNRKSVLKAAFAGVLSGVPYYYTWRDYRVYAGLGTNAFGTQLTKSDYKGRTEKGLDCSGFVCWAYYTGGITWSNFAVAGDAENGYTFLATPGMRAADSTTEITEGQLKSGDIGFISNSAYGASDHTGIYLGNNKDGKHVWLHCSGSQGATCNTYGGFKVFYTVDNMEG